MDILHTFIAFSSLFNRSYQNSSEVFHRLGIFRENYDYISGNLDTLDMMTPFADYTHNEFLEITRGFDERDLQGVRCPKFKPDPSFKTMVDWRAEGMISPARSQGNCGSCWAFATAAQAESYRALNGQDLQILSTQEIMDCTLDNYGCNGGSLDITMYSLVQQGVVSERDYPYKGFEEYCNHSFPRLHVADSCFRLEPYDISAVSNALSIQPLVAAVRMGDRHFQFYRGGVIEAESCSEGPPNHAVQLVGKGSDEKGLYWIVKNSWGEYWGENGGFARFRVQEDGTPTCGIGTAVLGFGP